MHIKIDTGMRRIGFLVNDDSVSEIEKIAAAKPDDIVVVDEAYADFGAQSCVPLTRKYGNLLVIMTFSKSRSMAGARLGFAIGNKALISDMNTIKYSINTYNVNSYTQALGIGTLLDGDYTKNCIADIVARGSVSPAANRATGKPPTFHFPAIAKARTTTPPSRKTVTVIKT